MFLVFIALTTFKVVISSEELVRLSEKSGKELLIQTRSSATTPGTKGCWKTQEKMKRSRSP
jgi:hypothetical protein